MGTKQMRWLTFSLVALAIFGWISPATAQRSAELDKALAYLRTQQQADGSFAGFGPSSTADAIFALAAADMNVAEVKQGSKSPIDYVRAQAKGAASDTGVAAKFVIALLLAGQSPTLPDGTDLVAAVQQGYNAQTGQYGKDVTAHAYALVALVATGNTPRAESIDALKKLQLADGGWSFDGAAGSGSDTNSTALAIQALKAAGDTSDAIDKAVAYLRAQQNADGGFPYSQSSSFGNASDANSTALSIQALIAAGQDPAQWQKDNQATPAKRLLAFQNASGAFRYQDAQPDDNQLATYQAVPALAGKTLPLEGIAIALPALPAAPSSSPAPAPVSPPAGAANQLPNTGAVRSLVPIAVMAVALLLAGLTMTRRRA